MTRASDDGTNKKFGVTDEQLDEGADEYESDTWSGHLGEVMMGRPKLYDEDLETVSFRIPRSRIAAIDAVAGRTGKSRSEFLREAVDEMLLRAAM